ncbi:MAG: hypothetical protein V4440_04495 [Pseudomonadota bacterium]
MTNLGTALYESHGALCEELIKADYDLDNYYDGGKSWGDFSRVLAMVAVVRGAKDYNEYLEVFESIKQGDDHAVTPQLFARLTGIKGNTQTRRTNDYRRRQSAELAELRALRWIDENLDQAKEYIAKKTSVKQ